MDSISTAERGGYIHICILWYGSLTHIGSYFIILSDLGKWSFWRPHPTSTEISGLHIYISRCSHKRNTSQTSWSSFHDQTTLDFYQDVLKEPFILDIVILSIMRPKLPVPCQIIIDEFTSWLDWTKMDMPGDLTSQTCNWFSEESSEV